MTEVKLGPDQFNGVLKLGDRSIPCFVLGDKRRVIAKREVVNLLTGNAKGGLERYISAKWVVDKMPEKLRLAGSQQGLGWGAIKFTVRGVPVHGYEATDVIDICKAYMDARREAAEGEALAMRLGVDWTGHKLNPAQLNLAAAAEILVIACAKVGIEALIDEATGYEAVRDAGELQAKLKAFILEGYREWTETFPLRFFQNLYRLEGRAEPAGRQPYPKRFGRYVMNFVYDTMDKELADWLRKNNPKPEGLTHHHQKFNDVGYMKLRTHIGEVLGIMRISATMENFKGNLNHAYPDARLQRRTRLGSKGKAPDNQTPLLFPV